MMAERVSGTQKRGRSGRPASGRDAPLARRDILDAAAALVAAEGLEALSMRRLAGELGVTPMAIYHHVEDKPALLQALIEDVWLAIGDEMARVAETDPLEFIIQTSLVTRRVWLEHVELANLAMAVAPVDENLLTTTRIMALGLVAAGFPDPPLAFGAILTFTLGSVAVAANRKVSSGYFGRDPDVIRLEAAERLAAAGAGPVELGLLAARFQPHDDQAFEPALRALVQGLLT